MSRIILLLLAISLVGCTSLHYKHINIFLGAVKILGDFEVDVHSYEKQTFVINKFKDPSFLGKPRDGRYDWRIKLCYDNVDSLDYFKIKNSKVAMDVLVTLNENYEYNRSALNIQGVASCFMVSKNDDVKNYGWSIAGDVIMPDQKVSSPMIVEIQIKEDKDSVLQKLYDKHGSPHLIVYTGW